MCTEWLSELDLRPRAAWTACCTPRGRPVALSRSQGGHVNKVDIIWNITRVCPWDCAQCCVDAYHVTRDGDTVSVRHSGLAETITLPVVGTKRIFDVAAAEMVRRGLELSLEDKLRVVDAFDGYEADIDFSGGDP